jgi:hypothetical protein
MEAVPLAEMRTAAVQFARTFTDSWKRREPSRFPSSRELSNQDRQPIA